MKFSDMDEFLRDNPRWWENRKNNICTCEQQKYKEHLCPLDNNDSCNCCPCCTTKCTKLKESSSEL